MAGVGKAVLNPWCVQACIPCSFTSMNINTAMKAYEKVVLFDRELKYKVSILAIATIGSLLAASPSLVCR